MKIYRHDIRQLKWCFVSISVAFLMVLVSGVILTNHALADEKRPAVKAGEKLVTIYDRHVERTIVTKARTIREALKTAGITVNESHDVVEPNLNTDMVAEKYNVNIYRARPIVVVDGGMRLQTTTAQQTPTLIAKAAGLTVYPEDKTTLTKSDNLLVDGAGMVMYVQRAAAVQFVLYGKEATVRTHATTVADLLKEKSIVPGKDDTLSVSATAPIVEGMKIELWRNGKQTVTIEEEVNFETEKIQDANRDVGYRQVQQVGEKGKRNATYEIEMRNGTEVSRKEIASVVTKQPKKQIEIVGAKSSTTFSGSFAEALARLRSCEGSYTSNTGNGYYGAYQFNRGTWASVADPNKYGNATPAEQDEAAWRLYQRRGWSPWPACSKSKGLQDIYR